MSTLYVNAFKIDKMLNGTTRITCGDTKDGGEPKDLSIATEHANAIQLRDALIKLFPLDNNKMN